MTIQNQILVPIDFSPGTLDILDAAERMAEKEDCGLVILHAIEDCDVMRQRPPLILTDILDDFARLVHRIPSHRVRVLALEGSPIDTILDTAIACRCHTIVMGRGGQGMRAGHVASAVQKQFTGQTHIITHVQDSHLREMCHLT